MSKGIQLKTHANEKVYPYPFMPVGSIYLSVNSTNPSTYFGGTWVQICQGRLLAGVGSTTDADGNAITMSNGETGGSKTHYHSTGDHKLTTSEIPSHNHYTVGRTSDGHINPVVVANSGGSTGGATFPSTYGWTNYGSGGYAYVGSTGGSGNHNHGNTSTKNGWPPFFAVYMWKRTA